MCESNDFIFVNEMHCSHNSTMIQLLENLTGKLDDYGLQLNGSEEYWCETVPYHRIMWEAILKQDEVRAKEACLSIYHLDRKVLEACDAKAAAAAEEEEEEEEPLSGKIL